ncbi:MAG: hypothetical protein FJ145_06435 [Deltaproteobacteria bacterium]|nr:hypothetical protein [Deltaproteobacteria bacterium]
MAQQLNHLISVALLLVLLSPQLGRAAAAERNLDGIKKKIEREKQGLSQVQRQEGSVLQSLNQIESSLETKRRDLIAANANFTAVTQEVERLEGEREKIKRSMQQREGLLQKRAVALYRWYRGGSPVVLLNGDTTLGGYLQRQRYLQTTLSYDRDLVDKLSAEVRASETVRAKLEQRKAELDERRQALAKAQEAVQEEAEKKKEILASLKQEKESRVRALRELEVAAARLQKMMDDLTREAIIRPPEVPSGTGLSVLRGRLDWPVRGELKREFGKAKHREFATDVFRNGIDIDAHMGDEIRAVERGRIVFADRMAGYGKMIIVDHGERYYTIYAHLAEFSKKNGDSVRRGEPIGLVGDSDSLTGAGLYFEMRKDGRSIDPMPWFRR